MAGVTEKLAPFEAPTVDWLSVRVVVDSHYERFLPKQTHEHVKIEHVGQIPGRQMTTLAGEWGLSLHLVSSADNEKAQYLLDFGYTPDILNRNFSLLGIAPDKINGLILSHGHRDHYGGLQGFVENHRWGMRDDLSLFVGHQDVFKERWLREKGEGHVISWGALNRTALTAHKVAPVCCHHAHEIKHAFTSGYIERNSFETVTGGTLIEDEHFTREEQGGKLVFDDHPEEHATCYVIRGRGLVVISSCGHAGIINSVRTAIAATGVDRLHAVIGGFHLGMAPQDYIDHTVDALEELNPDIVVPMHCTGQRFMAAFRERMPEKIVSSNLGTQFTFGV